MISFKSFFTKWFCKTWLSYNIRFRSRYWVCNACIAYHQHRILGTAFLKHYQTSKLYFLLYFFEQKKKLIFLNFLTNALLGRPLIDTTIGTSGGLWPRASYVPDRCFIVGMLTCLLLIMHGFATWVPHQLYCRMVYFCKVLVVSKAKVTHNLRLNSYNKLNTSPDYIYW